MTKISHKLAWLFACMLAAGCEESSPPAPAQPSGNGTVYGGSGGGGASGDSGGGGDIAIGSGTPIAEHYKNALDKMKKQDWDGAHADLTEALRQADDPNVRKEIEEHLKLVERGLLAQPSYPVGQMFVHVQEFLEKPVSVRGVLVSGADVGHASDYFWLLSGKKVQCSYAQLPASQKDKILRMADNTPLLVRGILRSPWGNNPNPYMEVSYFRKLPMSGGSQNPSP